MIANHMETGREATGIMKIKIDSKYIFKNLNMKKKAQRF